MKTNGLEGLGQGKSPTEFAPLLIINMQEFLKEHPQLLNLMLSVPTLEFDAEWPTVCHINLSIFKSIPDFWAIG